MPLPAHAVETAPRGTTLRNLDGASWGLAAFDLAVTSGMRPGQLARVAAGAEGPAADYEARKRSRLDIEAQCAAEGLQFPPLVRLGA